MSINNTAVALDYDPLDEEGDLIEGVNINADGSFSHTHFDGISTTVITGTFTATRVIGNYTVDGACAGTFSGTKEPATGPLTNAAGFYSGTLSGSVTAGGVNIGSMSGSVNIIGAPDGSSFVFASASGVIGGEFQVAESGGPFTVAPNGDINATLLDGTQISGSLNTTTLSASGTFSAALDGGAVHSGTWSVTRQIAFEVPPPDLKNIIFLLLRDD